MLPMLDIVILLYKPGAIERRLVREISRLTPTPHSLHVFDNSGNTKNFSAGWNDLANEGVSPYIAFLHSDIYPCHGWEMPLIEALEDHENYGATLPNPGRFDQIGKVFPLSDPPTDEQMEAWSSYSKENVPNAHLAWSAEGSECAVFFCTVMRRSDFRSLCGFDERLRFVGNNHEFQWRLKERGLQTVMVHASSVWHKDALSFWKAIQAGTFVEDKEGRHWEKWGRLVSSGEVKKWHELSDAERLAVRSDPHFRIGGPV